MDWQKAAIDAANRMGHPEGKTFEAHRGAIPWYIADVVCVFGNDGYQQSDKCRAYVAKFREWLRENGIVELGFGLDTHGKDTEDRGYSWALLVEAPMQKLFAAVLHYMLWAFYTEYWVGTNGAVNDMWQRLSQGQPPELLLQGAIADRVIAENVPDTIPPLHLN